MNTNLNLRILLSCHRKLKPSGDHLLKFILIILGEPPSHIIGIKTIHLYYEGNTVSLNKGLSSLDTCWSDRLNLNVNAKQFESIRSYVER